MAFALEGFYTATPLEDFRFFRWYSIRWTVEEGLWSPQYSLLKKCTKDYLNKFYEYESDTTRQKVETLKAKDQFYCFDDETLSAQLNGTMWSDANFRSLSLYIAPCASSVVTSDGVEHGAQDDCIWN